MLPRTCSHFDPDGTASPALGEGQAWHAHLVLHQPVKHLRIVPARKEGRLLHAPPPETHGL
jgi:hypothetical protein